MRFDPTTTEVGIRPGPTRQAAFAVSSRSDATKLCKLTGGSRPRLCENAILKKLVGN